MPPLPGVTAVQTGVWYAPGVHWAVFDAVRVSEAAPVFVAADELTRAAAEARVSTPPVLARGRQSDMSALPVRFATRVPELFGLPRIEGNLAEGIVVKDATSTSAADRGIIKRKIEEFDEKRFDEKRFDESEAWDANVRLSADELSTIAARLVNDARVASAASKTGTENRRPWPRGALTHTLHLRPERHTLVRHGPRPRGPTTNDGVFVARAA